MVSVGINSTRKITAEDYENLERTFGFVKCESSGCEGHTKNRNDLGDVVDITFPVSTELTVEGLQPTGVAPLARHSVVMLSFLNRLRALDGVYPM